jgi:Zn-dependent peptidase ImmA (M78 family)
MRSITAGVRRRQRAPVERRRQRLVRECSGQQVLIDVTHELSHGILLHEPVPAFDEHSCRTWRAEVEDEAEWLAGVLLITEEAAVAVARRNIPSAVAAGRYGVSEQMMRYRLNLPGACRRVPGG